MRFILPALVLALGFACSADSQTDQRAIDPPPSERFDTADPPIPDEQWFSIETGQLDIAGGEVLPGSEITVSLWQSVDGRDAERVCSDVFVVDTAPPVEQPDDTISLFGMWSIDLSSGTCEGRPPALEVGIGPLIPDLWPSVAADAFSIKQTRGLYVSNSDRDGLWVFGLAGTPNQLAGLGTPPSLEPLPDGSYLIRGYYLLPL